MMCPHELRIDSLLNRARQLASLFALTGIATSPSLGAAHQSLSNRLLALDRSLLGPASMDTTDLLDRTAGARRCIAGRRRSSDCAVRALFDDQPLSPAS